jgi:hypothetical protein
MPEFLFWDGAEYEDDEVRAEAALDHSDVGSMHEPKPYTGDLDWDDDPVLHPFVD